MALSQTCPPSPVRTSKKQTTRRDSTNSRFWDFCDREFLGFPFCGFLYPYCYVLYLLLSWSRVLLLLGHRIRVIVCDSGFRVCVRLPMSVTLTLHRAIVIPVHFYVCWYSKLRYIDLCVDECTMPYHYMIENDNTSECWECCNVPLLVLVSRNATSMSVDHQYVYSNSIRIWTHRVVIVYWERHIVTLEM